SPTVHVTRFKDGHIGFNLQAQGEEKKDNEDMPELAHLMAAIPSLREIEVRDAWIQYDDRKEDVKAILKNGNIALTRRRNDVNGTLSARVEIDDFAQDIEGAIIHDPYRDVTQFTATLQGIKTNRIIELFPELPDALQVDMDLNVMA